MSAKKALIVDDDETLRFLAKRQLSALGISAVTVPDGKEALEVIGASEEKFDIIFMDVQMPEMDGLEATRLIREKEQSDGRMRTPIIALTASREKDAALASGMDDFLFKPVLLDALRLVVKKWLPD